MNLSDVADEIAAQLDTIAGLRCFAYQPETINPPTAIVLNPVPGGIEYDQSYQRGMDRITLPLLLVVGAASNRSAQAAVRLFCDGSGAQSVKAVVEAGTYTSLHTVRVTIGGIDGVTIGGQEYLAAFFDLDVTGQGS
jgi:hypothetical protein